MTSKPVFVIDPDSGYAIQGGPAIPVEVILDDDEEIFGGPVEPVYEVLPEDIDNGSRRVEGGHPIKIKDVDVDDIDRLRLATAKTAIPVYVVTGSFGPYFIPGDSGSGDSGSSGATTSITLAKPPPAVDGDLMIVVLSLGGTSENTFGVPAGWTELDNQFNNNVRIASWWRLVTSSEPIDYTWTYTDSSQIAGLIMGFRNVDQDSPVGQVGTGNSDSTNSAIALSITPDLKNTLLVMVGASSGTPTWGKPDGMTTIRQRSSSGGTDFTAYAARRRLRNNNATGNKVSGLTSSEDWQAQLFLIYPRGATATLQLNWTDNADNEDNYVVEKRRDGGAWEVVTSTLAADTVTFEENVPFGHTYEYRVKATNVIGDSGYSNIASITI